MILVTYESIKDFYDAYYAYYTKSFSNFVVKFSLYT